MRYGAIACVALGVILAGGCGGTPKRLPDPEWVTASALATEPVPDLVWPDSTWPTTSPEAVGLSRDLVDSTVALVGNRLPELRALLVVIGGRIVVERYFRGAQATEPINIKSVTKSVLSEANAVIVMASTTADPSNPILGALRENLLPMIRRR